MTIPIKGSEMDRQVKEKIKKALDLLEETNPVFSYVDYLKQKRVELYNKCHVEKGRFGEKNDPECGVSTEDAKRDIKVVGKRLGTAVSTAKTSKGLEGAGPVDSEGHRRMGYDLITNDAVAKLVARQALVPGFEDLEGRTDRAALKVIVERQADNIEEIFDVGYGQIGKDTAEAHAGWYPWVNEYAQELSSQTGLSQEGIMAAAATLSPSADWANNIAWTKATAEFVQNEKNIQVQPEWLAAQHVAAQASWEFSKQKAEKAGRAYSVESPSADKFQHLLGKTVADLSPDDAAIVLRGAHEAFGKAIHQLGGEAGLGHPKNIATPQSFDNFAKAISVLRNPSSENITAQIGGNHKVRSFYENMRNPLDNTHQEVTVDSHHLGLANGIPITGNLPIINGKPLIKQIYDGPKVAGTGLVGTYALVVEATRLATTRVNKKYGTDFRPNQVQSITWETWRGTLPSKSRTAKRYESYAAARRAYRSGNISKNEMLARIENARLDATLGSKGPTLVEVRKDFLDEIGKGG